MMRRTDRVMRIELRMEEKRFHFRRIEKEIEYNRESFFSLFIPSQGKSKRNK